MSVTNFNPSYYTSIRSNTQTNWPDTRSTTGTVVTWGQVKLEARSWYEVYRGYFIFDTSSLADNATISAARFLIDNCDLLYKDYASSLQIRHVTTANNTSFVSADYNLANFGQLLNETAFSSLNQGSAHNATLTNFTISLTGYTKIGLLTSHDYASSQPAQDSGSCNIQFTGSALILEVTWTTPPAVTSGSVTNLQPQMATLAGNVTDAGGGTVSTRGVCWALTENPTTVNSKAATTGTTGSYTVSATGLLPGTLYHYRAYVTTENSTQYGTDLTFRTPGGAILFNLL